MAGPYNSALTRVWPVFIELFRLDSTGISWLPRLLALLGQRNPLATELSKLNCRLNSELAKPRSFGRYKPEVNLPLCLEYPAPAPERFLAWLISHPEKLDWGRLSTETSANTLQWRTALKAHSDDAIISALHQLALSGSRGAEGNWWAFEGATSLDCYLESEDLVLGIEGKRTEPLSEKISWLPSRNQLARNLEVVQSLARGRRYGVLLILENNFDVPDLDQQSFCARYLDDALPHYSKHEREFLARHFLGALSWKDVCHTTGVPFENLPDRTEDFYVKYKDLVRPGR